MNEEPDKIKGQRDHLKGMEKKATRSSLQSKNVWGFEISFGSTTVVQESHNWSTTFACVLVSEKKVG